MVKWEDLARMFGYENPHQMVLDLYWGERESELAISQLLGITRQRLRHFMEKHHIPRIEGHALNSSPLCPYCGGRRAAVTYTKVETDGDVTRYRKCPSCGKSFKTIEIVKSVG